VIHPGRLAFVLFLTLHVLPVSFAQLPNTDIWLLDVTDAGGRISVSNPVNFTNREGYDNQPSFSPDGKFILFTSIREGLQSDIYKYDIFSGKTSKFTDTPESEYSPTFMPDGQYISVVRVEKDSTQRLWKFPINGGDPSLVLKTVTNVGYHCWIDTTTLALFILPSPFTLLTADIRTEKTTRVGDSIGRCLQNIHFQKQWSYYEKTSDSTGLICRVDLRTKKVLPGKWLALKNSEDYAWYNDSFVIMAAGSCIYKVTSSEVQLLADLSKYGISNIGRLTLSKDRKRIALVTKK